MDHQLLTLMLVSTKKIIYFWVFVYSLSIIQTERKAQHFNALYKTKIVPSAALLRFNYCSPQALCYPNEL
jgi:hypothetical protein